MKIITFNIRCADDENGHSVDERAPRLKSILEKYDADIIGFQEVTPKWYEIIKNDYASKYEIFNKFRCHELPESAPILWKKDVFKCLDQGYFWFSETPWVESFGNDVKYHCKRICEWCKFLEIKTGREFYYFNTHFGFGDEYQIQSVDLIKRTADILSAKAFVITGDFNMLPSSAGYKRMTQFYTDVNTLITNYTGTTFHKYGKVNDEHIDYCFINEDTVSAEGYRMIDDKIDGKYPSDHYGILFELNIK